jgi:hypothetical protein
VKSVRRLRALHAPQERSDSNIVHLDALCDLNDWSVRHSSASVLISTMMRCDGVLSTSFPTSASAMAATSPVAALLLRRGHGSRNVFDSSSACGKSRGLPMDKPRNYRPVVVTMMQRRQRSRPQTTCNEQYLRSPTLTPQNTNAETTGRARRYVSTLSDPRALSILTLAGCFAA